MLQKENNMEILKKYYKGKNFEKDGVYLSSFEVWGILSFFMLGCLMFFFDDMFGEATIFRIYSFGLLSLISVLIALPLYFIYEKFFFKKRVMDKNDYVKVAKILKQEFSKFNKRNLINYGYMTLEKVEAYGTFNDKDFVYNIMRKDKNGKYSNEELTSFKSMFTNIETFQKALCEYEKTMEQEKKFNSLK